MLIGVVFVILIGFVVSSRIASDAGRASEAPPALTSDQTPEGGEAEQTPVPGRLGRAIAGFVLLGGWIVGMMATIVRAQRRRRSADETEGTGEQVERRE